MCVCVCVCVCGTDQVRSRNFKQRWQQQHKGSGLCIRSFWHHAIGCCVLNTQEEREEAPAAERTAIGVFVLLGVWCLTCLSIAHIT